MDSRFEVRASGADRLGLVRWDELFADLESQASELARLELEAEVDERVRAQIGRVRLVDRLTPSLGRDVVVSCEGGCSVTGRLTEVGSEWVLVSEHLGREALIPIWSVQSVSGLARLSANPETEGVVDSRLGLRHALRVIARDRSGLRIVLRDGQILGGTIDRVGSDFVELAEHAPGEPRRHGEIVRVSAVAHAAIAVIRREV